MAHSSDSLALDVAVPVYNEQDSLERGVRTLHAYLAAEVDFPWRVTIADNASTDHTAAIADRLAAELPNVVAVHLAEKGRGRALKRVWLDSPAEVVAYLDVDLSTDLTALPPLVAPLLSGHSDVAIGTRLSRDSRVVRGAKREFVSRCYNLLLRGTMAVRFSDAQCGFKALRREVAQQLIPLVEDDGWFFDTELLIIAERSGLRIHEVPVDWIDDPHSSVDIVSTARDDLRGMFRVGRSIMTGRVPVETIYAELGRRPFDSARPPSFFGQVVRFGAVGVASTGAFALLYFIFQLGMPAQAANFLALLLTTVANTAANRRFTFGVRGRAGAARHQLQGLVVFGLSWLVTSGSLLLLHALRPDSGPRAELIILTLANLVATLLRFVLLRVWVFRGQRRPASPGAPAADPAASSPTRLNQKVTSS
ncbi:glycosyltransferase [Lacisediminihabitans sp.]|uniref:glycosyltransferase n=1 Tax=Lacisediminihabitans sp. TaxID=2787631 RepID=UPI00374D49A7